MKEIIILIFTSVLLTFTSCRLTRYLGKGELLYDGIDNIDILNREKSNSYQDIAISKAMETLEYETNGIDINWGGVRLKLPALRTWLYMTFSNDTTAISSIIRKFGSPPVLMSSVNPVLRSRVAQNILSEYGYLSAHVGSLETPDKSDSLKVSVSYDINTGILYRCDSIIPLKNITLPDRASIDINKFATLKKYDPFSITLLEEDRNSISDSLRQRGFYYFRPDMIVYKADTMMIKNGVVVKKSFIDGLPQKALQQWRIAKVNIRLMQDNGNNTSTDILLNDRATLAPNITLYYNGRPSVRKNVLNQRLRLRPNDLYSQKLEDITLRSISNLGTFSSSEFLFTPVIDTILNDNRLNLDILLRPDNPWDVTLEALFKSKSNNFIGPGLNLTFSKSNLFGGGETLSTSISGSYEWQRGHSIIDKNDISIHSYQAGLEFNLTFPTLLFPGQLDSFYNYSTSTNIRLGASLLNRPLLYNMQSFGLNFAYDFQPKEGVQHHIQPFGLNYTLLSNISHRFKDLIKYNPSLGLSYRNQFIPQAGYSFTFDNMLDPKRTHHIWMHYSISEAGNLINAIMTLTGKKYSASKNFFGVHFAQFVKATAELRYTYAIDVNQTLATRFSTGAIYSYGNASTAPFMEEFYVGGANSIRAFTVRSVGPGRFSPISGPYSFMDQVGDFKLEGNIEYRGRLQGRLHGAIFVDAGNVWLIDSDSKRQGGSLRELRSIKDFLNQIAVGTGVGLRYDLDYIVIRFDVGIGLHLPYLTSRKGWYNIPKFKDSLGFHLAVGYPF